VTPFDISLLVLLGAAFLCSGVFIGMRIVRNGELSLLKSELALSNTQRQAVQESLARHETELRILGEHHQILKIEFQSEKDKLQKEQQLRIDAEAGAAQVKLIKEDLIEHRKRLQDLTSDLTASASEVSALRTNLENGKIQHAEQQKMLEDTKKSMTDSFKSLSAESLQANNTAFIQLAEQLQSKFQAKTESTLESKQDDIKKIVEPIRETLQKFEEKVQNLEASRIEAYIGITQQFTQFRESHDGLKLETGKLVKALRTPNARGRWGELQLRRVVEFAGMQEHCDFAEQESVKTEENNSLRPDMIIRLPGDQTIVVDSKAVIEAYLDACSTEDESVKAQKLAEHAKNVRSRVDDLSKKQYWSQFRSSPEFVVLFLPGEAYFSSALEHDPSLIERSIAQKVIVATPTTLIALLKAASYGWRQNTLAKHSQDIFNLGKELYARIDTLAEHFNKLGNSLKSAVTHYNKSVGSLERNVLSTARKLHTFKISAQGDEPATIDQIEADTRSLQAPELSNKLDSILLEDSEMRTALDEE
jgi:DNA recombination protein RmuC